MFEFKNKKVKIAIFQRFAFQLKHNQSSFETKTLFNYAWGRSEFYLKVHLNWESSVNLVQAKWRIASRICNYFARGKAFCRQTCQNILLKVFSIEISTNAKENLKTQATKDARELLIPFSCQTRSLKSFWHWKLEKVNRRKSFHVQVRVIIASRPQTRLNF